VDPGSDRRTRQSPVEDGAPNLLVDIQPVQGGFFGNRGIRRYTIGLASALLSRRVVRALLLNPGRQWHEEFPVALQSASEVAWSTRPALRELARDAAAYVITSPFEQTSPVESALPPFVVESGMPIVSVLYDLIPETIDVYPPSLMPTYWARRELLREADLLLTLSQHVRREAIERLAIDPARVAVVGAGVSDFFRPRRPGERPRDLLAECVPRVTRPFALSVTGWLANKNAGGLMEAWSRLPRQLRDDRQLVLTCPLPPDAEGVWNDMASGLGLAPDDVVVTGQVGDHVVRALYQEAELFVAPSYEEGFGLPVLEAAVCGCPVITSNASSLPEVLEWDPSTFPPHDVDAIAGSIERGLLDSRFRADLRAVGDAAARRHTWDSVVDRTIRACAGMPAPRRPRRDVRLRVAIVGRLSEAMSRVAAAVDRATALLKEGSQVDCFDVAPSPRSKATMAGRAPLPPDVRRYPARALGQVFDPWGYDTIVYVLDRHPAHELLALARDHPGVVWFVDAPNDRVLSTDLARRASAILRSPEVAPFSVDPGPFGRRVPTTVASPEDAMAANGLLEAFAGRHPSVTRPDG
jgi:glycosyltransferase involved in cell wall biosynthesis